MRFGEFLQWFMSPMLRIVSWDVLSCVGVLTIVLLKILLFRGCDGFKVFNHISKIIFVCTEHESNLQVVNGGIFFDLSNQLLDAFSISRFLPGNQHQQMMDIQAWTWEYGDNIHGILRSAHVFLACHVLILYYC